MTPHKRIARIAILCGKRAVAEKLGKRKTVSRIDNELQPLMREQLAWELKQDRKQSADGWQDFPSDVYGDAR